MKSQGPPSFDRAAHLRDDLDYLESRLDASDSLLIPVYRDQSLVRSGSGGEANLFVPRMDEAGSLLREGGELVWLGELQGRACFAVDISDLRDPGSHGAIPGDVEPRDLRFLIGRVPAFESQLAGYARGILYWHRRHRFCGQCGGETRPRKGGHLRVCADDSCNMELFPRTDPAVLVLVRHAGRVLLGRQPRWPAGMYSTLAGFVEPGETLEQAVAREVFEETGVEIGPPVYRASQPWPFPASLMLGFTAEARSERIELGDDELEDARWFTREELLSPSLPGFFVPPRGSLAGELLHAFMHDPDGLEGDSR